MEIQLNVNKLFEVSIDTNPKIIYEGEKIEDKITISNKTDKELTVNLVIDQIFVSFSDETILNTISVKLNSHENKQIPIYYTYQPNYANGKKELVKITAKADYSSIITKEVNIIFKSKENPKPRITFAPLNAQSPNHRGIRYYKGSGKVKIGILNVSVDNEKANLDDRRGYNPLDLTCIMIDKFGQLNIDCLTIDKIDKPKQLIIGDKPVSYDVYCEYDGEQSGDYRFKFTLLNESTEQYTLRIKEQIPPQEEIVFTPLENPTIYYKGEGKRKIGDLKITAKGEDGETSDANKDKYKFLDLSNLSVVDNKGIKLEIDKTDKPEQLIIGDKSVSYDVFCDYNGEIKGEVSFGFTLCDLDNNENTTPYRMKIFKQGSPVSNNFESVGQLDFSTLKDTGIVGHLISNYTNNEDDKRYYTIENGVYKITDENYSFDKKGRIKEQFLEVGHEEYPIYINFNKVFGDKQNIDQDIPLNIHELRYIDSRDTDVIDAPLTLRHTPAKPEPHVCLTTNYSNENKELVHNNEPLNFEQWRYNSDLIRHTQSYEIANLNFSNKQILPCGDNRIKWDNIKIKGDCIIPIDGIDDIEINNGEEKKSIPIIADLAKITDETNKITIVIEYQCTVNDLDAVAPELEQFSCTINIPILEEVVDDWYSIDLGTTGIVVAKWNQGNGISAVHLDRRIEETHQPIEVSDNIISSITVLMEAKTNDDSKKCKVVVAPSSQDLKQKAKYMLVPTKFMVGQDALPFINEYKKRFPDGILLDNEEYSWDTIRPEDILKYTYRDIFSRVSPDECEKVRKLIVTYPNTYSPNSLDWLKQLIIGEKNEDKIFKNLSERNLHFIPESDSVVAYYISKLMDREDEQGEREHVVIYDMGAGTLDLSYVTIEIQDGEDGQEVKSTIEKRIGIPIAGEYFSYLIYECYKDDFQESNKKTIKTWIDKFKAGYDPSRELKDVDSDSVLKQDKLDQEQGISETVEEWVEICTEKVLKQLLGNEWKEKIDRIVFSGRGSQFKPIRDKMSEICKGIILDDKTISNEELKQCVANGAILYQQIFENPNMPFSIEHKNTYEHVGMRYQKLDGYRKKWEYKELMNENDLIWDENVKDGAYFAHVEEKLINELDLRYDGDIIFYLTSLDENAMSEIVRNSDSSKEEVFVKELFIFPSSILTGNRKNSTLRLSIDLDNNLSVSINGMNLLPHTTLPNVEKDKYYVKCNWYFDNERINN